jgi:uncharacterized caspase-like protein
MTPWTRRALLVGCAAVAVLAAALSYQRLRPAGPHAAAVLGPSSQAGVPGAVRPVLWLLSIGVSQYQQSGIDLQFADADARAVAELLKGQGKGPIYSETKTLVLTNEEVTRESILDGIERFLNQAGPEDVATIFMAGHGVQDRATGSYYFLPYPANAENLLTAGLRMSDFDEMIRVLRRNVHRVVVMLDTCHAGALHLPSRAVMSADDLATQVEVDEGLFLLAAAKPGEESKEEPQLGHGAFTYALLEGLRGAADTSGEGLVSVSDLFGYVARRVPRLTEGAQHPYHKIEGTDLTFAAIERVPKEAGSTPALQEAAQSAPEQAITPAPNAIGVMEFHNLRADAEHDWVAKALRAAMNTELSKVRMLHVYSPDLIDRTRKLPGSDDLRTARQLGLSKLVTGSFVVVGDTVRIDVNIVDAVSGMNQGSDSVQGSQAEFFELEKKLVLNMLRRLPVELSATEGKSIQENTNTNVNAYRLLLEAEGVAEEPVPNTPAPTSRRRGNVEPQSQRDDGTEGRGRKTELVALWPHDSALSAQHSAVGTLLWAIAFAAEPVADTKAEVLHSLEEYRQALEEKDLDRLSALYVSFSTRQRDALRAYLENATELKVEIADVTVEPHGDDVTISFIRRDRFVDKGSSKPTRLEVRLNKILVREGGKWKIAGGA